MLQGVALIFSSRVSISPCIRHDLTAQSPIPANFSVTAAPAHKETSSDFGRFYEIKCSHERGENSVSVRMKMDRDATILVRWENTWVNLETWLSVVMPLPYAINGVSLPSIRRRHINCRCGKPFRILNLPRELRDMIYDTCATFNYPGYWRAGCNYAPYAEYEITRGTRSGEVGHRASYTRTDRRGRILNGATTPLGLLLTSKQVSEEFYERMWKMMEFRFFSTEDFMSIFDFTTHHIRLRPQFSQLSRLALETRVCAWLELTVTNFELTHTLQRMPLSHLTIFIRHHVASEMRSLHFLDEAYACWSCPQVLVGYILLYLERSISHIRTVEVMGCVSEKMKANVQRRLSQRRKSEVPTITEYDIIGESSYLRDVEGMWMPIGQKLSMLSLLRYIFPLRLDVSDKDFANKPQA